MNVIDGVWLYWNSKLRKSGCVRAVTDFLLILTVLFVFLCGTPAKMSTFAFWRRRIAVSSILVSYYFSVAAFFCFLVFFLEFHFHFAYFTRKIACAVFFPKVHVRNVSSNGFILPPIIGIWSVILKKQWIRANERLIVFFYL